ncbi:MAG: LrgB family protein [Lachnospiraceae bacterium]|nr:LrgB family protein [Lachnospiraceae bacterium]
MDSLLQESLFFGFFLTLACYFACVEIAKRYKSPLLNPLFWSIVLTIVVLKLLGISYSTFEYGAKYLNYLLTPITVCLAVPLYRQLRLLRDYADAVIISILSGTLACAAMIFLMSKMFGFDKSMYASMAVKSITTAIALGVNEELGGIQVVSIMAITITGTIGPIFATSVYKLLHIKEPIAQGLALGTGSHAIGTSRALELGEIQGAMSSLAIVVTGVLTVIIAPILYSIY